MKIIDEKGRLFGKLNLIDLLVIVLLLAVVFAVVWKLGAGKAAENASAQTYGVDFTVVVDDVHEEVCAYAETQVGQSIVNSGKVLNATLTGCEARPQDDGKYTLYLSVSGTAGMSELVYKLGPQDVRVGFEYIVKTSSFELTGTVCDLEVTNG